MEIIRKFEENRKENAEKCSIRQIWKKKHSKDGKIGN